MAIDIRELHSQIDVMDPGAMIGEEMMEQIVQRVLHELEHRLERAATSHSETDMRSIVDQQRGGRR
jgi:hypothetical protein